MAQVSINSDYGEWALSADAGERARLLQSPSVDTAPKNEGDASPGDPGSGTTSTLGAIFIVVNACLGAGLLNFPAAFSTAGGVAAGVTLQMVSVPAWKAEVHGGAGAGGLYAFPGKRSIRVFHPAHTSDIIHLFQLFLPLGPHETSERDLIVTCVFFKS